MKRWPVETQVLAGFSLALAVLVIVGASLYYTTVRFIDTSEAVSRSQRALTVLEGIYSLMNQAETQQRSYLLLGGAVDLAPRHAAVTRMKTLLAELAQLTADDPAQQARLPELERRIADRLTMLDAVLEARRTRGFEAGRRQLAASPGRAEMRKLHELVVLMQTEESARLEQRQQAAQQSARRTLTTLGLLLALVAAALTALYARIRRESRERRLAEAQRARLLLNLEAANEELKSFAYVVSHDLKAPLRGIGSLSDWLASDYAGKLDEQGREYLALMKNRVTRMDALIDGILEYSRVGRIKETRVAVDLNALVADVVQLLAPPAGVAIAVDGPLPTVIAERTRLQQLFQNLISNAIKHLDKPAGRVRIACADEGSRWRFSVADNGPGIDSRHHERIFQLFQTLTPRDRKESTGVGLALVRKIVELYGGRVWVESEAGQGSTFFFTLPKAGTLPTTGEAEP